MLSFANRNLIKYTNVLFKTIINRSTVTPIRLITTNNRRNNNYNNNNNNNINISINNNNNYKNNKYKNNNNNKNFISNEKKGSNRSNINVGLLNIPELVTLQGWPNILKKAIDNIDHIYSRLLPVRIKDNSTLTQLKEALYLFDEISKQICNFMDAAQFVRYATPDNPNREAISALNGMSEYLQKLNEDFDLYNILIVVRNHRLYDQLPDDHKVFISEMIRESELNGINLKFKKRQELSKIKELISDHGIEFVNTSARNSTSTTKLNVPFSYLTDHLPQEYIMRFPTKRQDGIVPLVATEYMMDGILRYIPDPKIRESAIKLQSVSDNYNYICLNLVELIKQRFLLGNELGFPNFSTYELQNKLLNTPSKVNEFLKSLSKKYKEKSDKELNKLIEIKKRIEPDNPDNDKIFTYDLQFYRNQVLNEFYKTHSLDDVSEYFTLGNVLNGLNLLVNKLFDAKLVFVEMGKDEGWNPYVSKLQLLRNDEAETLIGTIYLDPWKGREKAVGGVNHTIRLGFKKLNYLTENSNDDDADKPLDSFYNTKEYELPISIISCPLEQNNLNEQFESRLEHKDVEVLFHEFGHALHILMSRCNFQHLCGTRGPIDFVEIPSTLMENFCWDEDFLQQFAINSKGEPIPIEMIRTLKKIRSLFEGIDTQEQIAYAMFDLNLHSITTSTNRFGIDDNNKSLPQVLTEIYQEYSGIHGRVSNKFLIHFNHLYFYGSTYYSYLLAKNYSNNIWENHFGSGKQLTLEKGRYFQQNFLRPGFSQTPLSILNKFIK
ncbi:hypothetical protein RB653_008885 [Dictyostelium firmibasis]|uniref:Peptidase M3A/M3B catalytic domain-containing protein n=1 Tax=Dictyostelium firmibasis TaxID=79012 RepID=A0AAN7U0Y1_9MYCE